MCKEIEELIDKANVTPTEVAEQLLKEDEVDDFLRGLINFLDKKIKENEEEKIKKVYWWEGENVANEIKEKGLPNGKS